MKTHALFLLILVIVLSACTPQRLVSTPAPTLVIKPTPSATITPKPTQTPEATPAPALVPEYSIDSCNQIVEAQVSDAGFLEVIFETNASAPSNSIVSKPGYYGWPDVNLALWHEDTQKITDLPETVFPLPADANDPKISSSRRWVIFERNASETQSELWITDPEGKAEKKLATVSFDDELKARYNDYLSFDLEYEWMPNTDMLYYEVSVIDGMEFAWEVVDKLVLVDINSGNEIPLIIQSEIKSLQFSPDGSQMIIFVQGKLRVVNTQDGKTQFTVQASFNYPGYSPDGKYILDFVDGGILRIDATNGEQKLVPLKYTIPYSTYEVITLITDGAWPRVRWIDNSTFIFLSLDTDEGYSHIDAIDPDTTIVIGQIDLAGGTTRPIHTFRGRPQETITIYSVSPGRAFISLHNREVFSPDMKRLAFSRYELTPPSLTRYLVIADLASGKILATIEGGIFERWLPDSEQYLYVTEHSILAPTPTATTTPFPPGKDYSDPRYITITKQYLGQIGKEPILIDWDMWEILLRGWWVDQNRLVRDCKVFTFR